MAAIEAQKQRYQGVQKESAGYKLMAAMGWKEGEGLGASKQGIKEHIRVKKNYENWGVGAVTAADRAKEWTAGMADFHRVLSTLSEITSQHAGKKPGEDSDDEAAATTTDEESDASDGELKKAKKKKEKSASKSKGKSGSKADKKKRKKEEKKLKQQQKKKNSSSSSSDEDEEEDASAAVPHKRVKLATHLGRFKKRESAKMVSNYSTHDLAAILGEDPFAAAAAAVTAAAAGGAQSSGGYESDSESESEDTNENKNKKKSAKKRKVITIQEHQEAHDAEQQQKNTDKDENQDQEEDGKEYWWSSYFVRRGKMGSLRRSAINRARGFSEQDQTDLYSKVQDGATQGRVGLGRSSMPKKVAGARWEGKKKKLGSDSESESEGEQERREAQEAAELEMKEEAEAEARGVVVVLRTSGGGGLEKSKKVANSSEVKKIKWKKVVADVFARENSKSMKLKAVVKAVMHAEGLGKSQKTEVSEAINSVVEGSSKFKLDGKNVRLV